MSAEELGKRLVAEIEEERFDEVSEVISSISSTLSTAISMAEPDSPI